MVDERSPADVAARLDDLQVIDVRDPDAYREGHIPGAENVQIDELEEVVEGYDWADEVVVACYVGESSVPAARLIDHYSGAAVGVASLAGGYEAWNGTLEEIEGDET